MNKIATEVQPVNEYFGAPNQPTRLTSLGSPTQQARPAPAAQVGFFNVEWHQLGNPDELLVLPVCSTCNEPITDFSMGIAVADFSVEQSFQPAGEIGNYGQYGSRPIKKVPGQLFFFHKGEACDTVNGIYSVELDKIFRFDQRRDSQTQQDNDNV